MSGVPVPNSSSLSFENEDDRNMAQHTYMYGAKDWGVFGDVDFISSELRFCQYNTTEEEVLLDQYRREQQLQLCSDAGIFDDILDIVTPPFQEDISKFIVPEKEKEFLCPLASLGILKNFGSKFSQLNGKNMNLPTYDTSLTKASGQKLSTIEIVRLAGEKFIKSFTQGIDDLSDLSHPFDSPILGLSDEETRDIELVQDLLASAETVGQQQFKRASKLLNHCDEVSSDKGNPVQRLVHYFSVALREKIDRETGKITEKGFGKKQAVDLELAMKSPSTTVVAFHRLVPFCQVSQFAGIQAVIDNVAVARKVHIIDLEIRAGTQWSILMQALASRHEYPLEHLKITAIGTKAKPVIEGTGNHLTDFAESMNLPFSFNMVMLTDMMDLSVDLFELDQEETVAVYSANFLWTMIAQPSQLDSLMRVISFINPCVLVVNEVEANHNSPLFVNRFTEALFYNAAFFDCVEDCMGQDNPDKIVTESCFFCPGIRNIVAAEGDERTIRHVNLNMWRVFFERFGMRDTELSMSSLYQASLMVNNFGCGGSCTLEKDGNSLIIGWKGTPILSLSAWKFL